MNRSKTNNKSNQRQEDSDNESVEEETLLKNKQNRDTAKRANKESDGSDDQNEGKSGANDCKELFVKNLPFKADEKSLTDFFGKYGEVTNVKVLKDRDTGRPRGIGFVEFSSSEEAQAAMDDADNIELEGRQLTINFSNDKDSNKGPRQDNRREGSGNRGGDGTTVFVGNLGFKTTEDAIKDFFEGCGTVNSVRIAEDENGRRKGFAHVDFDSNDSVQKAIEKNGTELDGRSLRVDASTGKSSGGSRGGRGGFGGGRGGGRGGFGGGRGGRGGRGGFRGGRR